MGRVVYNGGPCDGTNAEVSDTDLADGFTVCRAFQYRVYQVTEGNWLAQPPEVAPPTPSSALPPQPTAGPDVLTHTTALGGWNTLMKALGRDVPASLTRASAARRIIRGG